MSSIPAKAPATMHSTSGVCSWRDSWRGGWRTPGGCGAGARRSRGAGVCELLLGVLAPSLRGPRRLRALRGLQPRLLHALARDVPRDRGVLGLPPDLVHLVDVDDAALGLLHVMVGG